MKQYIKYLNPPQSQPIPGQNMIKNNGGGYSYEISDEESFERFLLIGSEGGTYYITEDKLTADNANRVIYFIKKDSGKAFDILYRYAKEGRAPKHNTILFCYALILTFADENTRKEAYKKISDICHTPTHLFSLLTFLKPLRGWSRGLRTAVASWYLDKPTDKLAYQMVKYRSRSGYTHKDILRLCHPKCTDEAKNNLLKYAVGKNEGFILTPNIIAAYEQAKINEGQDLIDCIRIGNLTWEMIPTDKLNDPSILNAFLPSMPLTALMRNLNRFAYNAMTEGSSETTALICKKLTSFLHIVSDRLHPINVINTFCTYASGHGDKGKKSWTPNQAILDALHETYELSMKTIEPTGKQILIGVDISGSMTGCKVANMQLTAAQLSLILAHTMIKTEPLCEVICFDTEVKKFPFGARSSIDEILKLSLTGGGTDCALPLHYAVLNRRIYDAIIILTDCETWAGNSHSMNVLKEARRIARKETKVIEIALAPNNVSNVIPDKNVLRVAGFDSGVITLIQEFLGR